MLFQQKGELTAVVCSINTEFYFDVRFRIDNKPGIFVNSALL